MAAHPSPGSLIVTFYGAYGRRYADEGAVPVAALIRLLGTVGVDAPSVRSAVSRLKRRGLLVSLPSGKSRAAGYAPSAAARQLLADGDQRVWHPPRPEGDWLLAAFSVPERERRQRHLLRSRLARLGFGTAAPGLRIAPSHVEVETRNVLERLGLSSYVDLFSGAHTGFDATATAVARWWDLETIAELYREFLQTHEPLLRAWNRRRRPPAEEAYRDYLLALEAWRRLPYADPGLPLTLLPSDWPGVRAAEVFSALDARLREAGGRYVASVIASS